MSALAFAVPGACVPKARPRVYGRRTVTDPRTVAYERRVSTHALQARQRARIACSWPLTADAYRVTLIVFDPDLRRRDADNEAKAIMDACNGVLWDDDSRVRSLRVICSIDRANPRVVVMVETATRADLDTEAGVMTGGL